MANIITGDSEPEKKTISKKRVPGTGPKAIRKKRKYYSKKIDYKKYKEAPVWENMRKRKKNLRNKKKNS